MLSSLSSHKNFLLAFTLLGAIACSSTEKSTKAKQAGIYFGAGTQSLMQREYTDALTNLLNANELDPNNSEILNNLGMAYYFKDEKPTAVKHIKKAIELDSKNTDAKLNLASIYFNNGDLVNAEKIYKVVLKDLTYSKQARTYYNLGALELKKRNANTVTAENYFKKSVQEDENYCPSYYQLGLLQYQRHQFNGALKNFREATMGVCYETPVAHYYQALTLTALRRFADARIKFDEIETKFKKSAYASKARTKMIELTELEKNYPNNNETQVSRKVLEAPDF